MKTQGFSKLKNSTKLIRVDEITWIETSADVPDYVARQNFLDKISRKLAGTNVQPVKKVNGG